MNKMDAYVSALGPSSYLSESSGLQKSVKVGSVISVSDPSSDKEIKYKITSISVTVNGKIPGVMVGYESTVDGVTTSYEDVDLAHLMTTWSHWKAKVKVG